MTPPPGRPSSDSPLIEAGWSERVAALFTAAAEPMSAERDASALALGRVAQSGVTHAVVVTDDGWITATSEVSADEKDISLVPTTGDWVVLDTSYAPPVIVRVLPRWSTLTRSDALGREEQLLAADIDLVIVVLGLDRPRKTGRVERALALAWDSGAQPVIVLTKTDLVPHDEVRAAAEELAAVARGVDVLVTAAKTGSGVSEIHELLLPNRTAVLIGESGSGKSTLVNALVGDVVQATGDVRESDSKGRHTTTTRDLVPLTGGGVLIDTPGIRGVGLWDASEGVARVFDDLETLADQCRFPNCEHRTEPGCAVLAAVDAGEVDGERVERWLAYIDELDEQDQRRIARERAAETKAAGKAMARAARAMYQGTPGGRQKGRRK